MNENAPVVTVVIPTCNRTMLLRRALASVAAQTVSDHEVVVVVDGPDPETEAMLSSWNDERLRFLVNETSRGGGETRNVGARAARGRYICFLDDDDEFLPNKIERQLAAAAASTAKYPVVYSRVIARFPHRDIVWPRRMIEPDESVVDYLFLRRGIRAGNTVIQTTMLCAPRELLMSVPFDPRLKRHQDSDWLVRAADVEGMRLIGCEEVLSIWYIGESRPTVMNSLSWKSYSDWLVENGRRLSPKTLASFILTYVGVIAARERDWSAFIPLLKRSFQVGTPRLLDLGIYFGEWFLRCYPIMSCVVVTRKAITACRK